MSVTFEAASATFSSQGGTTLAPGAAVITGANIPSGSGTGWLAIVGWANADGIPPLYDEDTWTFLGTAEGGEGTWIADSGIRHLSAYWTEGASLSDPQTFTNGGTNDTGNLIIATIVRCTKTLTYWDNPQVAGGADNVGGAAYSTNLNRDPGGEVGDLAVWGVLANTDAVNPAITLTWPGVTGTATLVGTTPTGAGHDARIRINRTPVTSGASTGDVPSVTSATTFVGPALMVRLRDTNTEPLDPPVAAAGGDAVAEPWLSFDLNGSTSSYASGATFEWEVIGTPTGTVVIADDAALVTTATVAPTAWADEDVTFRLTVTDAAGTSTDDKVVTVLRSSEMIRVSGVDKPLRLTY